MTTVITVPPSLDDHSFVQVLDQVAPLPLDEKILVDARHVRWSSPYGLTALLTLKQQAGRLAEADLIAIDALLVELGRDDAALRESGLSILRRLREREALLGTRR